MTGQRLPLLTHGFVLLQQLERQTDQVVKVHALVSAEPLLVVRHDAGDDALVVVSRQRRSSLCVQALVLPQADGPLPAARGGSVHGTASVFQDAGDIVAVQNGKIGFQAQRDAVLAQHAHAQRMKGADHHRFGGLANQRPGALAHLGRCLGGESDRHNAPGFQTRLNQAANLVRDDACLAGSGTCHHEAGAVHEVDGFLLGQVQAMGGGRGGRRHSDTLHEARDHTDADAGAQRVRRQ